MLFVKTIDTKLRKMYILYLVKYVQDGIVNIIRVLCFLSTYSHYLSLESETKPKIAHFYCYYSSVFTTLFYKPDYTGLVKSQETANQLF